MIQNMSYHLKTHTTTSHQYAGPGMGFIGTEISVTAQCDASTSYLLLRKGYSKRATDSLKKGDMVAVQKCIDSIEKRARLKLEKALDRCSAIANELGLLDWSWTVNTMFWRRSHEGVTIELRLIDRLSFSLKAKYKSRILWACVGPRKQLMGQLDEGYLGFAISMCKLALEDPDGMLIAMKSMTPNQREAAWSMRT